MSYSGNYGLDSIEREERFMKKLAKLAALTPEQKRRRMKSAEASDKKPLRREYYSGCYYSPDKFDMDYHGKCFM